jgi:hypothetical protein
MYVADIARSPPPAQASRDLDKATGIRGAAIHDHAIELIRLVQTVPNREDAYINAEVPQSTREKVRLLLLSTGDGRRIPGVEHHHAGCLAVGTQWRPSCTVLDSLGH